MEIGKSLRRWSEVGFEIGKPLRRWSKVGFEIGKAFRRWSKVGFEIELYKRTLELTIEEFQGIHLRQRPLFIFLQRIADGKGIKGRI